MFPLLLVGFLSILGQVVLLRELAVAFFGVELVYLLALGVWLTAGAGGALLRPGRHSPAPSSGPAVGVLLAAAGAALLLEVAFIRGSRPLVGGVPGAYLTFGGQMVVMVAGVAPAGALLALLFQRAAVGAMASGRTLAFAYAVESAGGLLGGAVSAAGLAWGVSNFALGALCTAVALLGAALVGGPFPRRQPARWARAALAAAAGFAILISAPAIDRQTARWNHPDLIASRDSPYGRVAVTGAGGQVAVFENDSLSAESESTDAEAFVHLGLLAHPTPRRVLLLGGTVEGAAAEVIQHGPASVDVVEPDAVLLATALPLGPAPTRRALADPRVRLVVDDPRHVIRQGGSRYDVILSAMPDPTSGEANRFFTREFFEQVAGRLAPGGVFAFRLKAAENYWTPALLRRTRSIDLSARAAFRSVVVLPGSTLVFLASNAPLGRDPAPLARRLVERRIHARLVSPAYISYLYSNDRFADTAARLAAARAPENTDSRPVCYELSALIWLSKFFPPLGAIDPGPSSRPGTGSAAAGAVLLLLVLLLARRSPRWRVLVLVFSAGLIGMVLETTLLLHYQLKNGVVYRDLGVLLTSFMAGLAAGAWLVDRWAARARTRGGLALVGGTAALAACSSILLRQDAAAWLPLTCMLLALAGALVSGIFAVSSLRDVFERGRQAAWLYSADLLGGAVGSVAASLVLIPLAGLGWTLASMALLALGLALVA